MTTVNLLAWVATAIVMSMSVAVVVTAVVNIVKQRRRHRELMRLLEKRAGWYHPKRKYGRRPDRLGL